MDYVAHQDVYFSISGKRFIKKELNFFVCFDYFVNTSVFLLKSRINKNQLLEIRSLGAIFETEIHYKENNRKQLHSIVSVLKDSTRRFLYSCYSCYGSFTVENCCVQTWKYRLYEGEKEMHGISIYHGEWIYIVRTGSVYVLSVLPNTVRSRRRSVRYIE